MVKKGAPPPADYLFRAATCYVKAARDRSEPLAIAKALYDGDQVTPICEGGGAARAYRQRRMGGAPAAQTVSGLLQAIVSLSAAAGLLVRALRINFDGYHTVKLPGRVITAGSAVWLGEGTAISVRDFTTNAVTLTPHKLGIITQLYERTRREQ